MTPDRIQTTLRLNLSLWEKLRIVARNRSVSGNDLMIDACRKFLEQRAPGPLESEAAKQTSIRLPPDVHARLSWLADSWGTSMNSLVMIAVANEIEED